MTRRKSPRQITVRGTKYAWIVSRIDAHHLVLRVWAAERRRRDYPLEVRLRYDDPWLNFGPIITAPPERRDAVFQLVPVTPGMVRSTIDAAVVAGWGPHHPPDARLFERGSDGCLVQIDNPRRVDENPWAGNTRNG